MLGFWQILGYMLLLLLFFFPFGYLAMHWKENDRFRRLGFVVRLPVYLAVGMAVSCLAFFILGHLSISMYATLGLFVACLAILLIRQRRLLLQMKFEGALLAIPKPSIRLEDIPPLLIFILSVVVFVRFVSYTQAMPIWGDPVEHSLYVSVFLHHGQIVYSLDPIAAGSAFGDISYYPLGFHALAAFATIITTRFPGEVIFFLAACAAALIPCLLYSFVYTRTRSPVLSLTAFLLVFMAPTLNPFPLRSYAFYAGFIQGVYPALIGILFVLCFGYLSTAVHAPSRKWHQALLVVVALAVLVAYRNFFPLIAIYAAVAVLYGARNRIKALFSRRRFIFMAAAGAALVAAVVLLLRFLLPKLLEWTWMTHDPDQLARYYVPPSFLITNVNGCIILAASIAAIALLFMRKHILFCLFHLSLLIPFYLAFNWYLFQNLLWPITPMRSVWILIVVSYVSVALFVHVLSKTWQPLCRLRLALMPHARTAIVLLLLAFVIPTFVPPLSYQGFAMSNYKPHRTAVYPNEEEYEAMAWIEKNVPFDALLLNDMTWAGHYVPAFGLKNQISFPYRSWPDDMLRRMDDCRQVLDDPANYTLLHNLIERWQIKYIYITSTNIYPDFSGIEFELVHRWWDSKEILALFDQNPDMRVEFRTERVGVYSTYLAFALSRQEDREPIAQGSSPSAWTLDPEEGTISIGTDCDGGSAPISFTGQTTDEGLLVATLRPTMVQDLSNADFVSFHLRAYGESTIEELKFEIGSSPADCSQYVLTVPLPDTCTEQRIAVDMPLSYDEGLWRPYNEQRYNSYASQGQLDLSQITYFRLILKGSAESHYTLELSAVEAGCYLD